MSRATLITLCVVFHACATPTKPAPSSPAAPEKQQADSAQGAPSETPPASADRLAQDEFPEIALKILDSGAAPKKDLRMQPKPGQTVKTSSEIEAKTTTFMDDQKIAEGQEPVVVHAMQGKVLESSQDQFKVDWTVQKSTKQTPGVAPELVARAKERYEKQGVTHGVLAFNTAGHRISSKFDKGTLEQSRWVSNLLMPLPQEPVGVGAKWETKLESNIDGISCIITNVYTLKSMDGDNMTLALDSKTTAVPGPFSSPDLPPNVKAEVESMLVTFTGEIQRQANEFFHESGKLSGSRELVLKLSQDGKSHKFRTQSKVQRTQSFKSEE